MRARSSTEEPWLLVAEVVAAAPPDGSDVGEVIRWYRQPEGLTQQDAAVLLNTTQSRLSKLEKGAQALRDVVELRHIAARLGIPPERLGVLPDRSSDARPRETPPRRLCSADRGGPVIGPDRLADVATRQRVAAGEAAAARAVRERSGKPAVGSFSPSVCLSCPGVRRGRGRAFGWGGRSMPAGRCCRRVGRPNRSAGARSASCR